SGDKNKISEYIPKDEIPDGFNWVDYSIIRLPFELMPKGVMDEKVVASAKASVFSGTYQREYAAVFPRDSSGFFRRTLIDSCVVHDNFELPSVGKVCFQAATHGNSNKKYVYG